MLQRIESHAGLVILASNLKSNIDNSFTRRFNAIIEFENPDYIERQKLWNNYLPKNVTIDPEISIKEIAKNFELSGANIVNVIQFAGLKTLEKKKKIISKTDIITGIKKEYQKEGKMTFFDCVINMPKDDINKMLVDAYSQNIANEWFKVQERLLSNLSPETDIVRLYKPEF